MSRGAEVLYFLLLLVLPLSALFARRLPMRDVARYALGWLVVAGLLFLIVRLLEGSGVLS